MRKLIRALIGMTLVTWAAGQAQAGIVLNSTRLVYPAQDKEAVLSVSNRNRSTILLQSWLEAEDPSAADLPFAVVPTLVPLPPWCRCPPADGKRCGSFIPAARCRPIGSRCSG